MLFINNTKKQYYSESDDRYENIIENLLYWFENGDWSSQDDIVFPKDKRELVGKGKYTAVHDPEGDLLEHIIPELASGIMWIPKYEGSESLDLVSREGLQFYIFNDTKKEMWSFSNFADFGDGIVNFFKRKRTNNNTVWSFNDKIRIQTSTDIEIHNRRIGSAMDEDILGKREYMDEDEEDERPQRYYRVDE